MLIFQGGNLSEKTKMKKIIAITAISLAALTVALEKCQALSPQLINPAAVKAILEYNKWRCETIPGKFDSKKAKLDEKKEKHLNAFNNLSDKFGTLIIKLSARGYDTAELKEDQLILDEKIEKMKDDYDSFSSVMKEAKEYACKKTDAEFKTKLGEARNLLAKIKEDAGDIKEFYKDEIREDIKEVEKM